MNSLIFFSLTTIVVVNSGGCSGDWSPCSSSSVQLLSFLGGSSGTGKMNLHTFVHSYFFVIVYYYLLLLYNRIDNI